MTLTEIEVLKLAKKHSETKIGWITDARINAKKLNAIVTGDGFLDLLIEKIEHIEHSKRATARKKYSKDIRDVVERVIGKRENVFQSSGGSELIITNNESVKAKFADKLTKIKGTKSLSQYLAENYFQLLDIDPNGLIMLEYKIKNEVIDVYPTYKSIDKIRHYVPNGQKLEYVVFEPVKDKEPNSNKYFWRIVDDVSDWTVIQENNVFTIDSEKTFDHPFKEVPAIIISPIEQPGIEIRLPYINKIIPLLEDYARDKSVLTIYKCLSGFPRPWSYAQKCRECNGVGKTGMNGDACKSCNSTGVAASKSDVTDEIVLPMPKHTDDAKIGSDVAGFIAPELETWTQYEKSLDRTESQMKRTIWDVESVSGENETATGKFIDTQPIINKLNTMADSVQWVHNQLGNWVLLLFDKTSTSKYVKTYGRRYIIESYDAVQERYIKSKEAGVSTSVLDEMLEEVVLTKYKSDVIMQQQMIKKVKIEPFVHFTIDEVSMLFGNQKAAEKILFAEWWKTVDGTKEIDVLKADFQNYFSINKPEKIEKTSNQLN